jgi:hypothetical protein
MASYKAVISTKKQKQQTNEHKLYMNKAEEETKGTQ